MPKCPRSPTDCRPAGPADGSIRKLDIDVPALKPVAQHIVFFELDASFSDAHAAAAHRGPWMGAWVGGHYQ